MDAGVQGNHAGRNPGLAILQKSLVSPDLDPMRKARRIDKEVRISDKLFPKFEFDTFNPKSYGKPVPLPRTVSQFILAQLVANP